MIAMSSSPYLSGNGGQSKKIRVRIPPSGSAREIRDAILRDHFGYVKSDIEELDRQHPGKFYICLEGSTEKEATPEQIKKLWRDPADGLHPMTLNDSWLKHLPVFLKQRVAAVLNQSVGAISDAKVRTEVLGVLERILKSTGNDRITALSNLIAIGSSNPGVSDALGFLIAQDGYADNPFLLIARARLDTTNYTTKSGPGYDTLIQPLLLQAIKKANESFNSVAVNNSFPTVNRADAVYINRQAAWMFAQIGKDSEFQERDWLARFYEMSDEERAALQEGDVISIVAPGVKVMSTPRPLTAAEKDYAALKSERQEELKRQNQMDKGRGIVETNDPRAVDRTEIVPDVTTTTEIKGSSFPNQQRKDAYPPGQNQRNPPPGKNVVTTPGTRINQTCIKGANAWGGGLELILKGLNAKIFQVRMEAITRYLAEKKRLEIIIANERRRVVPLKPATVERLLADLRRHGRTTANQFEKEKILKTIAQLERLREESYAVWNRKK